VSRQQTVNVIIASLQIFNSFNHFYDKGASEKHQTICAIFLGTSNNSKIIRRKALNLALAKISTFPDFWPFLTKFAHFEK